MLLWAALLLAGSSCTQSTDTPQVKHQEPLTPITLHIEGTREDVPAVDEGGKAISLTGNTNGSLISSITITTPSKVKGIVCIYDGSGQGFIREVEFDVNGRHISFYGDIELNGLRRGQLTATKMDIYVGGDYTYTPGSNGPVEYNAPIKTMRTTGTMNLGEFNPIFVSLGNPIVAATQPTQRDYNVLNSKFRLFGEFVSFRFRNPEVGRNLRFDGLSIAFAANQGFRLRMPTQLTAEGFVKPVLVDNIGGGGGIEKYYPFADGNAYSLNGPTTAGSETALPGDPAYTVYLFTEAQPGASVRFAHGGLTSSPIVGEQRYFAQSNHYMKVTPAGYKYGKYYNTTLRLRYRNTNP